MKRSITYYSTLVFDCDGVVLNSNQVKTRAFYLSTLPYGEAAAQTMVDYHVANGGVSRYKKFAYFLDQIVPHQTGPNIDSLLKSYAEFVYEGLLTCDIAPGLEALRRRTSSARWLIVSGGDQAELRDIFWKRGISSFFDGGIFGSPDTKHEILARELQRSGIITPALFLGDSKYDYQAATQSGLSFIFLTDWTEVTDWKSWIKEKEIDSVNNLNSLDNMQ